MWKKGDLFVVIAILMIFVAAISGVYLGKHLTKEQAKVAVITYQNQEIRTIALDLITKEEYLYLNNKQITIQLKPGKIRFRHANCPEKFCINTGWLANVGDFAACLPNQTAIRIEGYQKTNNKEQLDGMAY